MLTLVFFLQFLIQNTVTATVSSSSSSSSSSFSLSLLSNFNQRQRPVAPIQLKRVGQSYNSVRQHTVTVFYREEINETNQARGEISIFLFFNFSL